MQHFAADGYLYFWQVDTSILAEYLTKYAYGIELDSRRSVLVLRMCTGETDAL